MKSINERLEEFYAGGRPEKIPYTVYRFLWKDAHTDPAWQGLYKNGMGVTYNIPQFSLKTKDVECKETEYRENGKKVYRFSQKTPLGEVFQESMGGWCRKYPLITAEDYRIMTFITRNTAIAPDYESYKNRVAAIGPYGVPLSAIGRSPFQTMLVDMAGLENFSMHLYDFEEEVRELYEALLINFKKVVEITARGPGTFVSNLENFTAESLGPKRYEEFLLPVYETCYPELHEAGKIVGSHYDGRTSSCKELIARAPIDLIESLTEPTEGDMTLAACRAAWPKKLFWCNIRVGDYQLPPQKLRNKVMSLIEQGSLNGKQLAFEVSEHLPLNWKESLPIVLDTLNSYQAH